MEGSAGTQHRPIDRRTVVTRHNPEKDAVEPEAPFQVGNGSFAVGVDETGLQTFSEAWTNTLSDWGWHTAPPPEEGGYNRYERQAIERHGRTRHYMLPADNDEPLVDWLRANPHRIDLGQIGFRTQGQTVPSIEPETIDVVSQKLDLWTGIVTSDFEIDGDSVSVETCCHPYRDIVAARVDSPLVASGELGVELAFPGPDSSYMATDVGDWTQHEGHDTLFRRLGADAVGFERRLDDDSYSTALQWDGNATLERADEHRFVLDSDGGSELAFVCSFSSNGITERPSPETFDQTRTASTAHWPVFWRTGGAIDLSESDDPRWEELERRIVRSQYVMAVNATGSSPPQESGLVNNTWHGKLHLEMTLTHGLQFVLWGREYLVSDWFDWFLETGLPAARRNARELGCKGARWQKMIDPEASWQSPGRINPLRETQQGHAIYWMETLYQLRPRREILERYAPVVFETADYMADTVTWDPETERYVLGPPIVSSNEATDGLDSFNPTVELSYWAYGLETAQQWRERLGMARKDDWETVVENLSRLPTVDGMYAPLESHPDEWGDGATPAWLQVYGCYPGTNIDPKTMETTYESVLETLDEWGLWGSNFAILAMTAARFGRPDEAIDLLLLDHPQNGYEVNGCNVMGNEGTTVVEGAFLPGNATLLWAIATMVTGWEDDPTEHAPGFPDGWTVRAEGFRSPK